MRVSNGTVCMRVTLRNEGLFKENKISQRDNESKCLRWGRKFFSGIGLISYTCVEGIE